MTLEEIKEELAVMPQEQQDHLAAYLNHLRHLRDPMSRKDLGQRIDDRDPAHRVPLDQLRDRWKD
jgi:hypothetical protein